VNASRLVRLYPRAWRDRYGPELEDILAARSPSPGLLVDVLLGALDAHTHPQLAPQAAGARGGWAVMNYLRCRPTRGFIVTLAIYGALVMGLGWLRRVYGFSFGLDFLYFAMNGLVPLLWLSGEPPNGLRQNRLRLLVILPGALLAGLVGTVLTNGLP
jgi:hypothetical protein